MVNRQKQSIPNSEIDLVPLHGKYNLPLRLYMQDDRPVTDQNGFLLQNIVGKNLACINIARNSFVDMKGLNLVDALGRTSLQLDFDPTMIPLFENNGNDPTFGNECHTKVYDINGFPLTDKNGRPLLSRNGKMYLIFGPRGDPISDYAGRDVIDKLGKVLTRHRALKQNDKALFMFDQDGKPLTDNESFPLLDITGMKMILFDENNIPYGTLNGSELYDAEGIAESQNECDFTKRPPSLNLNIKVTTNKGEPAIAFDSHGFPLTDLLGNPLTYNNGNSMISFSLNKWIDYNNEIAIIIPRKVYDKFTLRGFTNSSGQSIRLFDDYGRPLTDLKGVPQRHASGKLLIKFNQCGAPVSDWLDRPLYDANGCTNGNSYFRPCLPFLKQNLVEKILKKSARGVQYFECTGMPLTNILGYPLLNAKEEPMLIFDNGGEPLYDYRKKMVYNALGLPLIISLDLPLHGPGGLPIRLYDKEGRPLTDSMGIPLKDVRGRHMIRVYSKSLGILDIKGRRVYDKDGNSTKFLLKFNASGGVDTSDKQETVMSVDGKPMLLYDMEGYPLTEQTGMVLSNRMGQSMIKCPEQGFTTTIDDKPVYDYKGRKCLKTFSKHVGLSIGLYDKNSRPLTDRQGSVLHNRKGQELVIFDKNFKPFSALIGGDLYDYKGMPLKHPFADPSHVAKTPLHQVPDGEQLFDYEDLPLTDISGNVLYTSNGIPMISFDMHGRVKCDHSGRPVFDIRGLAVSRISGAWKDQCGRPYRLFDHKNLPLTDENGRDLYDISGKSLIRQDSVGRPKFTVNDSYVRDAKGRGFMEVQFKPILISTTAKKTSPLLEEDRLPLRLYDSDGNPLTDIMGCPLASSKGELLLNMKNGLHMLTDSKGRQVYDRFRIPLGCSSKTKIKTMAGLPMILYDDKGLLLTDEHGLPLRRNDTNEVMIVFDMYGRPSTTESGTKLYDHSGRCNQHPQFGIIEEMNKTNVQDKDESLITVYDKEGRPMIISNERNLSQ